jgi:hypothetical protein
LSDKYGRFVAPVKLIAIEDQLVVHFVNLTYMHPHGLLPGDIIISLNGTDINEIIADMMPYVPYPTADKALAFLAYYYDVLRAHTSRMEVIVLRDGVETTVNVLGVDHVHMRTLTWRTAYRSYELLEGNIGLINPGGSTRLSTTDIFADTDGMIIDLRQYPTGSMNFILYYFGESLFDEFVHVASFSMPYPFIPGMYDDLKQNSRVARDSTFMYDKDVVVLMDIGTMSAGETMVMYLRHIPNITFMGSDSIGANGNVTDLFLPGRMTMSFSSLGAFTPEGGQTQRIGLSPDIYIYPTIKGIREGRDGQLEAAIRFIMDINISLGY